MQTDAGNLRDQAIGHAAGQVALDRVVLSVPAPAGNDVIAFAELFKEFGNIGRIILHVAVHEDQDIAG